MNDRAPSMLKATLIGGSVFGALGAIPVLNLLNCACCALVIAGGFLASYLYSQQCRAVGLPFRAGNGALVGLVAGMFYAVASTIVSGLVRLVFPEPDIDQVIEMLEQFNVPPESIDMAVEFMESSSGIAGLVIGFFVTLLLAAVFSTVGGLIGGAAFKVEPPAAPPEQQGPPTVTLPPGGGTGSPLA